jgi:hypothetical protein
MYISQPHESALLYYKDWLKSNRCHFYCYLGDLRLMDKKTLINEYKQRKVIGGIYRVTNTRNGKYLLDYATNLQAKQNAFDFMTSSGSCLDYRLRNDLEEFGGKVFTFEIINTIEKKKEQTQEEFVDDLKVLAQMCGEKLDPSKKY